MNFLLFKFVLAQGSFYLKQGLYTWDIILLRQEYGCDTEDGLIVHLTVFFSG